MRQETEIDGTISFASGTVYTFTLDEEDQDGQGKEITSVKDACDWMLSLVEDGKEFHFDDDPTDIMNEDGEPLFYDTGIIKRLSEWRSFGGWELFEHPEYGETLRVAYRMDY
jgi:hypothetical protein